MLKHFGNDRTNSLSSIGEKPLWGIIKTSYSSYLALKWSINDQMMSSCAGVYFELFMSRFWLEYTM